MHKNRRGFIHIFLILIVLVAALAALSFLGKSKITLGASKKKPVAGAVLSGGPIACATGTVATAYVSDKSWLINAYNSDGTLARSMGPAFPPMTSVQTTGGTSTALAADANGNVWIGGNLHYYAATVGDEYGVFQAYTNLSSSCSNGGIDPINSWGTTAYPLLGLGMDANGAGYSFDTQGRVFKGAVAACAMPYASNAFITTGFANPIGIAVNNMNVYVLRNAQGVIAKYNASTGASVSSYGGGRSNTVGIAADANGNAYTVDNTGVVWGYNAAGSLVATFGGSQTNVVGIALDGNANVYVTDNTGSVREYTADGTFVTSFGGGKTAVNAIAGGCRANLQ